MVERVIEAHAVRFAAPVVAERFLAQIGDSPVDFQVQAVEIVQLRGKIEYRLHQRRVQTQGARVGFLVELANIESTRARVRHLNLDVFWIARLEHFAERDGGIRAGRCGSGHGATRARHPRKKAGAKRQSRQTPMRSRGLHLPRGMEMREPRELPPASPATRRLSTASARRARAREACAWHSATARASEASAGSGISERSSRDLTIS